MHRAAREGGSASQQLRSFTCAERSAHQSCLVPKPLTMGGSPSITLVTLPVPRLSCLVVTRVIVKAWVSATAPRTLFRSAISAPRGETEAQGERTQPQSSGLPGSCPDGYLELRFLLIAEWSALYHSRCPMPCFLLQSSEEAYLRAALSVAMGAQTLSCPLSLSWL